MAKRKTAPMAPYVYAFGAHTDGNAAMRETLGGRVLIWRDSSHWFTRAPGFTLSTELCTAFYARDESFPKGLEAAVVRAVIDVEKQQGKRFGDPKIPIVFCPLRRPGIHAGHDGYDFEPGPQ